MLLEHSETSDNRPYMSSNIIIDNPHYDDDSTTPQNEQIETVQDPQKTNNDIHQSSDGLLEQTQQINKIKIHIFLLLYQLVMMKMMQMPMKLKLILTV